MLNPVEFAACVLVVSNLLLAVLLTMTIASHSHWKETAARRARIIDTYERDVRSQAVEIKRLSQLETAIQRIVAIGSEEESE